MAQHDYQLADQNGLAFLSDVNDLAIAIATRNSGGTEPAVKFQFMEWPDTTSGYMKVRNEANTAWLIKYKLSEGELALLGGSAAQTFSVAPSTSVEHAVRAATISTIFNKANSALPAFTKTGAGTISVLAGTSAMVAGTLVPFAADTAVTMPSLTLGTDYAIYFCTDGTVRADANFSAPTGYTTGNSRKIGGFHYAPGGNATGTSGGDTTPAINQYSIWDLKFRPTCPDPRGMALVADGFWSDIYLLGVDHPTNGTSKYNVTIADGSSPPKIPIKFGGNGTTAYAGGNWWDLHETLRAYGKRHPTYSEFAALAYGTTEASSSGTDPVSTILSQAYTSKWGVMLAAGNMFVWGDEFGGGAAAASWTATTGGRGSTYQMENAVLFGGAWGDAANSGSRCSYWLYSPTDSSNVLGARGVCDHLQLD